MESGIKLFGHAIHPILMIMFAGSWLLRRENPEAAEAGALVFSFAGVVIALIAGWLGGELVERLGVGVDSGANVNAPSSLSQPHTRSMGETS